MKAPIAHSTADSHNVARLNLSARVHASGFAGSHVAELRRNAGATRYVYTKPSAIITPETENTSGLWCERLTNHGAADNNDATVAPMPNSTNSDGKAQHSNVPTDVNSDR